MADKNLRVKVTLSEKECDYLANLLKKTYDASKEETHSYDSMAYCLEPVFRDAAKLIELEQSNKYEIFEIE